MYIIINIAGGPQKDSSSNTFIQISNCTTERNRLLATRGHEEQDIYIPTCHANGSYTAVQCYSTKKNGGSYCWCVTSDGEPVPRTSVKGAVPDCMQGKQYTFI